MQRQRLRLLVVLGLSPARRSQAAAAPALQDPQSLCRFEQFLDFIRAGHITFHTLRHSCASAMLAAGAPITEVQHRLGHASPAITLHVYSHFLKQAESGAADRLADLIRPKLQPAKTLDSGSARLQSIPASA